MNFAAIPLLAAGLALPAAAPPPAQVFSAASIAHTAGQLTPAAREKGVALAHLADMGGGALEVELRGKDGAAEVHAHFDDLLVVLAGTATLVSGGTVMGGRESAPGETRGSGIRGGVEARVGPGDVIHVPAGTPHQFLVAAGTVFSVLAVKLPR